MNGEAVHGTRANPTPGGFDWGSPDGARRRLAIDIPKTERFKPVIAVECEGSPAFQPGLQVQNDSLILHPPAATLFDGRVREARSVATASNGSPSHRIRRRRRPTPGISS
jgi:hypothetical protein